MTCNNDIDKTIEGVWKLIKRITFWLLFAASILFLLPRLKSIVVSVLVAVFLTYILLPGVDWLCRKKWWNINYKTERLIATILVFIVFIAFFVTTIALIVSPFQKELKDFLENMGKYRAQLAGFMDRASHWYQTNIPVQIQEAVGKIDYSAIGQRAEIYLQRLIKFTTSSIGIIVELILIPVLSFYFVLDFKTITREFYGAIPAARRREAIKIGRNIGHILQSYIFGQLILCLIAGLLTGLFLTILQMPYVVVLALFSGITRAIPVIGPVLSGVPIILVGLLNFPGLAIPLYLLLFVTIMHFAESKFIMPKLIGQRMHLHPALVIIVLLIGAEFFGILGMFLAAPVAAVVRELVRFYYIKPRRKARTALVEEVINT